MHLKVSDVISQKISTLKVLLACATSDHFYPIVFPVIHRMPGLFSFFKLMVLRLVCFAHADLYSHSKSRSLFIVYSYHLQYQVERGTKQDTQTSKQTLCKPSKHTKRRTALHECCCLWSRTHFGSFAFLTLIAQKRLLSPTALLFGITGINL